MTDLFERWKPAASARAHVLTAALLWTCVGIGLSVAGVRWCVQATSKPVFGLLIGGVLIGVFKGKVALSRTAAKSAARIARRGDGTCLGGFLSWKSWVFVLAMMGLGIFLRHSAVPRWILGVLYTAVGVALLWGSRVYWAEWSRKT